MRKHDALQLLAQHQAELVRRFGITDLALFGSIARDEARDGSDIDVMVSFDGRTTAKRYFGVQFYPEVSPVAGSGAGGRRSSGIEALYRKEPDPCLSRRRENGVSRMRYGPVPNSKRRAATRIDAFRRCPVCLPLEEASKANRRSAL